MSTGAWFLVVTLAVALAFGVFRAFTDGRFRGTHRVRGAAEPEATSGPGSVLDGTPAIPVRGSVRLNSMTRIKRRRRLMGRESSQGAVKPPLTIS